LTLSPRHANLDSIDGGPGTEDAVAARITAAAGRLAGELGHSRSPQDAVAAARDLSAVAEEALQVAVDRAREAGQSWREIGDVLGTSRQAAFQRFGHPVDPRTGQPMSRIVPPGTVQRAVTLLENFTAGRWDEVLGECDESILDRIDADRLASGWAQMIGMFGSYESMGEVVPVLAGDATVVDVLLRFEAGEAMLRARFSPDGKLTALRLHPPSQLRGSS
jgi:hypothetical protein